MSVSASALDPAAVERTELLRLLAGSRMSRALGAVATTRFANAVGFLQRTSDQAVATLMPAIHLASAVRGTPAIEGEPLERLREAAFAVRTPQPLLPKARADQLLSAALVAHKLGDFPRAELVAREIRSVATSVPGRTGQLVYSMWGRMLEGSFPRLSTDLSLALGVLDGDAIKEPIAEATSGELVRLATLTAALEWINGRLGDSPDGSAALRLLDSAADHAMRLGLVDPYLHATSLKDVIAREERFRPAAVLSGIPLPPEYTRRLDRAYARLWPSQVQAIEAGVITADSSIVSMPTSAGKTLLAEMRIARDIRENPGGLSVYLAPYNALARQTATKLRSNLGAIPGVDIQLWTGTYETDWLRHIDDVGELPRVLVMTPEKFDSVMRAADSNTDGAQISSQMVDRLSLLVMDEIHLLGREQRGPKLELILMRLRREFPTTPIFALSAALTNLEQLAAWLDVNSTFRSTWRPAESWEAAWRLDGVLELRAGGSFEVGKRPTTQYRAAADLAVRMAEGLHPVLILETDRKSTERAATAVYERATPALAQWRARLDENVQEEMDHASLRCAALLGEKHPLTGQLRLGVAYHHAGVPPEIRALIEDLVADGGIYTLSATTTLAEGVDLPFRAVVIPSLYFQGTKMTKDLYLNIVGRAGRAGYHAEGFVVVVESEASSHYLRRELWNDRIVVPVVGQLQVVADPPRDVEDYLERWEIDAQFLAALGDRSRSFDVDDLAANLTRASFTGQSRTPLTIRLVERHVESRFDEVEDLQLATAASPLRLTRTGEATRLTGLSPVSGFRMSRVIEEQTIRNIALSASEIRELKAPMARVVARVVMEASEVFASTLGVRLDKSPTRLLDRWETQALSSEELEDLADNDLGLMSGWMLGTTLPELLTWAPTRKRGRFSGNEDERLSDLVEHLMRLCGNAAWVWSSYLTMIQVLTSDEGAGIAPAGWVGGSIMYGVPQRAGVTLCDHYGIGRDTAMQVAGALLNDGLPADDYETIRDWAWERQAGLVEIGVQQDLLEQLFEG